MLHNMKNDYRGKKKVLHVVVEADLHLAVRLTAAAAGVSITEFVTSILDREVGYGVVGVGSGDSEGSGASGGFHGPHSVRDSGDDSQSGASGRGVDWDAMLAVGRAAKVVSGRKDPIEEIA
jgi:hypothetical protein